MIFSVSDDGTEGSLDFGLDSVNLTVREFVQEVTINSTKFLVASWNLLPSQNQDVWNNHLPQFPSALNQKGTMEMRDELLSIVDAQYMYTIGYEVSDTDAFEFY